MKAPPTLKTRLLVLLLAAAGCCARAQNYPGASQYWSNQQHQQPQQQQQQPQHFQQYQSPQQQQQPAQQAGQAYHPQQQQQGHQQLGFGQHNGQQQGQQQQQPGFRQAVQPQQQQQQGLQQGLQQQQPGFQQSHQQGLQQQGQQQPGFQNGQQQQQQPGFQNGQQQQPGFQNGQQQQPGFRQQFGSSADAGLRLGETTPSPFQSRLFSAGAAGATGGQGSPNGTGAPGTTSGAPAAAGAAAGAVGAAGQQQSGNSLELEPFGAVKQPQPGQPDSQVFQTPTDQVLYAVDWSYPRARNAPASMVLKRWGGLSPPEYVAVYRLRGPTASSSAVLHAGDLAGAPSYSLARDEMRHYPWDAARRHGPPRWGHQGAPRDEDFELLPAGMPLRGHHADGHYGASQNYMYRTL